MKDYWYSLAGNVNPTRMHKGEMMPCTLGPLLAGNHLLALDRVKEAQMGKKSPSV